MANILFIFFQAIDIMNVAFGKDHPYVAEVQKEIETH